MGATAGLVTPPLPPQYLHLFCLILEEWIDFSSSKVFWPLLHSFTTDVNLYLGKHTQRKCCRSCSTTPLLSQAYYTDPSLLLLPSFRYWHGHKCKLFSSGTDWECGSHKVLPLQRLLDHTQLQWSGCVDSLSWAHQCQQIPGESEESFFACIEFFLPPLTWLQIQIKSFKQKSTHTFLHFTLDTSRGLWSHRVLWNVISKASEMQNGEWKQYESQTE